MVIGLDVHKRSVYGTVMEDNGYIIVQRNMETVNGFLLVYKDYDIVIEKFINEHKYKYYYGNRKN